MGKKRDQEGKFKKLTMREWMDVDKVRFYNLVAEGKLYAEAIKEVYGVEDKHQAAVMAGRLVKDPRYQHYHRNQVRKDLMRIRANGGVYLTSDDVIERLSTLALAGQSENVQLRALELLTKVYGMGGGGEKPRIPDELKTAYATIVEGQVTGIKKQDS